MNFKVYPLELRGSRGSPKCIFLLSKHMKQLLLVTFCDTLAGIEFSFWPDGTGRTNGRTDKRTDGQTNVEVEIVI